LDVECNYSDLSDQSTKGKVCIYDLSVTTESLSRNILKILCSFPIFFVSMEASYALTIVSEKSVSMNKASKAITRFLKEHGVSGPSQMTHAPTLSSSSAQPNDYSTASADIFNKLSLIVSTLNKGRDPPADKPKSKRKAESMGFDSGKKAKKAKATDDNM
jgi:hypothetical protein